MIFVSKVSCTTVGLCIIMICTDGVNVGMCPYVLSAAIGAMCYWLAILCGVHLYGYYIIMDIYLSLSPVLLYQYTLFLY